MAAAPVWNFKKLFEHRTRR